MSVITERNFHKYVDANDIKTYKKVFINDHYGNGLYLPGTHNRRKKWLYFPKSEGKFDFISGIAKTVATNLSLIKQVGTTVGSLFDASTKIAGTLNS